MSYFMRLQNLSLKAQTTDIREFFKDFEIPGGGIHIVGGKDDEAHINFASETDLLQALLLDKQHLCGTPVTLLLALEKDKKTIVLEVQRSLSDKLQTATPLQTDTLSTVPHGENGNKGKSPDCKVPERDYTVDQTMTKHVDIWKKEEKRPAKDHGNSHVDVSKNTERREVHKDYGVDSSDDTKERSPKKDNVDEPIVIYSPSSDSSSTEDGNLKDRQREKVSSRSNERDKKQSERKKRERSTSKERDRKHRKESKEKHDKNKSKEQDRKHNKKHDRRSRSKERDSKQKDKYKDRHDRSRSKERDSKKRDEKSHRSSSKEMDREKRDGSKARRDRSRSRESDRKHKDSQNKKGRRSRSRERDRQGKDVKEQESHRSKSERSRSRERDRNQRDLGKSERDRSKSREKEKKQENNKQSKSKDRENQSVSGGSLEKDRENDNDNEKPLGHVIVSKLPHTITEADLREYFGKFKVSSRHISLLKSNDNPKTLIAGVKFMTMSDAMEAEEITTPLQGQEIDIRFVSERMFNKTLESAASSEGQPVQGTALQETPDPASYWEKYRQQMPPGMWPWYYPPPGPFSAGMPYPPGYPGLPGPPPVGPHGAGPYYPLPPNISNTMTPPPGYGPQFPPFPGYQQKMDSLDLSKADITRSSKSTVSNVSVVHVQGIKNMTSVQGAEKSARSTSRWGKQEFHIRIHNLKNHMCANVLWSILKSMGAPCQVVRLVRSGNGTVLYAYATCTEKFAVDEISKTTSLSCFDVSKEDMEMNLRKLSPKCTISEAYGADKEHPATNLQVKLGGKQTPLKQATKTGVSEAETKGRLNTAVSGSETKGHSNTTYASSHKSTSKKHEDTAIQAQVQTAGCLRIDGIASDMSANRLHTHLAKVGAKPKCVILPIYRSEKANAGFAFAVYDNLSQDHIKNCKKVCQGATVKLITCSQMDNEVKMLGTVYRLSESTGPRWESSLSSKTSESQDSKSHSKADDKRSTSRAEDQTRKTKR